MPFLLISGVFNPLSGVPDGDSVRFLADRPQLFALLKSWIDIKANGEVQLRYEGIDALEKNAIQPFAHQATKANIQLLGGHHNGLPGYILASYGDTNGRPVSFVFTGEPPLPSGSWLKLDLLGLHHSLNYKLLAQGLVYPLFYENLYPELRDDLELATTTARQHNLGIWPADRSTRGFHLDVPPHMAELPPIFPKLWRRLEQFYQQRQHAELTLGDFHQWLTQGDDRLIALPDRRCLMFAAALKIQHHSIAMLYRPEEMVFGSHCSL